jgi:predicted RNase H-like HicB family nuclease
LKHIKVIIEKHQDGYVAYPVGIKGVTVAQGDSYEKALNDVKSATKFHLETFGPESLDAEESVLEAFVAEATV